MRFRLSCVMILAAAALAGYGCDAELAVSPDQAQGMVARYPFDGDARDTSGLASDGVVHGAALVPDRLGRPDCAYRFDGVNDYIVVDQERFVPGNTITVAFWVKPAAPIPYDLRFLISCSDFQTGTSESGRIGFSINVPSTRTAKAPVTAGVWQHVAGTYDGQDIRIYVNGELKDTTHHPGTISDPHRNLHFGDDLGGGDPHWAGELDDVRIYGRALTAGQVEELFLTAP